VEEAVFSAGIRKYKTAGNEAPHRVEKVYFYMINGFHKPDFTIDITTYMDKKLSALLLVFSIVKTYRDSKLEKKQIDLVHVSMMKEINSIQDSIRDIELDIEVVIKESGIQLSADEKLFMREVIDLYRRNYSIESIAEKKEVPETEIEQLLTPYLKVKDEGGLVANAN
jgi:hypothetical protein